MYVLVLELTRLAGNCCSQRVREESLINARTSQSSNVLTWSYKLMAGTFETHLVCLNKNLDQIFHFKLKTVGHEFIEILIFNIKYTGH